EIDMVLASPRGSEHRVTAPDRKSDHLGPMIGQLPSNLREEPVVANHHAELTEPSIEHRVVVARLNASHPFASRQADLAILARYAPIRREEHGDVIDQMLIALQ